MPIHQVGTNFPSHHLPKREEYVDGNVYLPNYCMPLTMVLVKNSAEEKYVQTDSEEEKLAWPGVQDVMEQYQKHSKG